MNLNFGATPNFKDKKLNKYLHLLFGITFIALPCFSYAGLITYNVERNVGDYGLIEGTITTDGTIGELSHVNIIDWNLALNADLNYQTTGLLLGPLSGNNSTLNFFPTLAIWTTSTSLLNTLFIDFELGSDNVFQIATNDDSVVWQMQPGVPFKDELIRESFPIGDPNQEYIYHGDVTHILGTSNVVAVPTPNSVYLFITALFLLFSRSVYNSHNTYEPYSRQ